MSGMFEAVLPFDEEEHSADAGASAKPQASRPDLPDLPAGALAMADADARRFAVDPSENVVLEASAGTGKTRVLVDRYVNLLAAGIDPDHILAITFTRKAAAEMRQRILARLHDASRTGELPQAAWRELRNRLGDIAISTIDAFCLSLVREFPLEADVDPAFELAGDTDVARLVTEALDHALRILRGLARHDDDVALVFAQLGERRLRAGLALLLDRRLVAPAALKTFLASGPADLTAALVCARAAERLRSILTAVHGGLDAFVRQGPRHHPEFLLLADDVSRLTAVPPDRRALDFDTRSDRAAFRVIVDRLRGYFLTQDGRPRGERFAGTGFKAEHCASEAAWKAHRALAAGLAPAVAEAVQGFRRDLNVVLSRGVWRMYAVVLAQYERTLSAHALLDFSGVLQKAVALLRQMDEFARSRYRLESRYHHVLVDEFQDTSRAQWELIAQLVRSWGEGEGASEDALSPSIFIVGDRKQSIYGFRHAEAALLDEAVEYIGALRGGRGPRRAISVSFRSAPEILAFVNDLFDEVEHIERPDAFRFGGDDKFPVVGGGETAHEPAIGVIAGSTVRESAERVAAEVERLFRSGAIVRDKSSGMRRRAVAADVAILFRSRDSHREFEAALERRGVATYVYKGLGFFDADEIQDAVALLRYLAEPTSNLRAAAFLRSRIVRVSDGAVAALAPHAAAALAGRASDAVAALPDEDRRMLERTTAAVSRWIALVDLVTPAELLDLVIAETAYAYEIRGARMRQARENLKKLRAMIRRIQNRGYATLARIAEHLDRLAIGDESNAAIDATDAVSLMTVHAAKGLEFPVVFVVNCGRGTGGMRAPIRVGRAPGGEPAVSVADYQSDADEDASARDREETKRLLYVALTRARDRLYLSTALKDGLIKPGRGSLAEVLPQSLQDRFNEARVGPSVSWSASSGAVHTMRVCPCRGALSTLRPDVGFGSRDHAGPKERGPACTAGPAYTDTVDFEALSDSGHRRSSVATVVGDSIAIDASSIGVSSSSRLIGTLVHRLLQRHGLRDDVSEAWIIDRLAALHGAEALEVDDEAALYARAARSYRAFVANTEVRALYQSGRPLHEVPFSLDLDATGLPRANDVSRGAVHGAIDCLILAETSVTVLEFKTGASRPEHAAQADLYCRAAATLFPGIPVRACLVYGEPPHS